MKEKTTQIAQSVRVKIQDSMKKTQIDIFNYESINLYLMRYGVKFMFGDVITPISYYGIKFIGAFLFCIIGIKLGGFLIGIGSWVLGFYTIDLVIRISNAQDNDKMAKDIRSIYDTLRLQTKANVYLLQALGECYLCVQSERLKVALLKLTSNMMTNCDIDSAIDEFNLQFKNSYIDTFCIIIKQSLESGKSVQILEDMSNQISDVQRSIDLKDKEALERLIQLFQLLLFVGMVAICLYYLCLEIGNGMPR